MKLEVQKSKLKEMESGPGGKRVAEVQWIDGGEGLGQGVAATTPYRVASRLDAYGTARRMRALPRVVESRTRTTTKDEDD